MQVRLRNAETEMLARGEADVVLVNDDLAAALREVDALARANLID